MPKPLRHLCLAALLSAAAVLPKPVLAQSYPIDCAILLCLAGGWPASLPCAKAKAEFIRRITPWPIEPPLQIWRCPMRASAPSDGMSAMPIERRIAVGTGSPRRAIALRDPTVTPVATELPVTDKADIDVSDAAFDFLRSLRVYQIEYHQHLPHDGDCQRRTTVQRGSYGIQGDYRWASANLSEVPASSGLDIPPRCRSYGYRAVFVEWCDHAGRSGFEEVRY